MKSLTALPCLAALFLLGSIAACGSDDGSGDSPTPSPTTTGTTPPSMPTTTATSTSTAAPDASPPPDTTTLLHDKIKHIVVVFAENRGFDSIYGRFPGANGLPAAPVKQKDRDGTELEKLPVIWGGMNPAGITQTFPQEMTDNMPNAPFAIETQYAGVDATTITRDLWHKFFQNQMQINGGLNDKFAAFADSGGLVMASFDGSKMAMWKVAQDFVLADNFFQGAFGGSFLNHQYLICGCAPEYPNADTAVAKPSIAALDNDAGGKPTHNLTINATLTMPSALDSAPSFTVDGNIAPSHYFGDAKFHAVNTMQPPYQPSGNNSAADDATLLFADPAAATTLPPQTAMTVGDQLNAKSVSWKWYSGAWATMVADRTGGNTLPVFGAAGSTPNFQYHHQPFNFYAAFDPAMHADARAAHLADYTDLVTDLTADTLPAVTFYKPEGDLNQHSGYTSLAAGDQHIADLIAKIQASPAYASTVVVVTYDENGGIWDHVAPPPGDLLGPGTRIPAIIVSPFAKKGTVDKTLYDTGSVLRLIARRFDLAALPGIASRDAANKAAGGTGFGDLTGALDLSK